MNYRKNKARRNRKGETKNSGNSVAREAVLKARAVRNNATAKEAMWEHNEYTFVEKGYND